MHSRDVISLMKPAFVWLGFRGPDCNVIAEKAGRYAFMGRIWPAGRRLPDFGVSSTAIFLFIAVTELLISSFLQMLVLLCLQGACAS